METSETFDEMPKILLQLQKKLGQVKKDGNNPHFNSSYATLNAVRQELIPKANELGCAILQPTVTMDGKDYVKNMIIHESGEYCASLTRVINAKGDSQGYGSGVTYARRYGLMALVNMGSEDDDGNDASQPQDDRPWLNNAKQVIQAIAMAQTEEAVEKIENRIKGYKINKKDQAEIKNALNAKKQEL